MMKWRRSLLIRHHCTLPKFHEFVHSLVPPTACSTAYELPLEQHLWVSRIDHSIPHVCPDDYYAIQGSKWSRTPCNLLSIPHWDFRHWWAPVLNAADQSTFVVPTPIVRAKQATVDTRKNPKFAAGQKFLPNCSRPHISATPHRTGCENFPYLGKDSYVPCGTIQPFLAMSWWGECQLCFK
jgi:hypothetical protein